MGKRPPREDHSKATSLSKYTRHSDTPSVVPSDSLGKAESEADTGLRSTLSTPVKARENVGQIALGDSNSRIIDRDENLPLILLNRNRDRPSSGSILYRVVQKIDYQSPEPMKIPVDGKASGYLGNDSDTLALGCRLVEFTRVSDDTGDVNFLK